MAMLLLLAAFAPKPTIPAELELGCVTQDEQRLYELITQYRKSKGLPQVPLSSSLSFVAHTHCVDLATNSPAGGSCNMHSWSNQGNWSPCCYTRDHKQAKCMWDKPRELTDYTGDGFEIACGGTGSLTPQGALECWQGSAAHNDVMTNAGMWNRPWGAMGVGIYQGYAVVWFGYPADGAGSPSVCN